MFDVNLYEFYDTLNCLYSFFKLPDLPPLIIVNFHVSDKFESNL